MRKPIRHNYVRLSILCGLSLGIYLYIFSTFNAEIKLSIYKNLYINYFSDFEQDFKTRFTKRDLLAAIQRAKEQSWVTQQIQTDLAPFKTGIDQHKIDIWFNDFQHERNILAKFTVHSGHVTAEQPLKYRDPLAYKTIFDVITLLAKDNLIPDCKFIIALDDYVAYVPTNYTEPVPIFSFAKDSRNTVEKDTILVPDWLNLRYWDLSKGRIAYASKIYSWDNKKDLIHWRGGSSDSMLHRRKLLQIGESTEFLDVGMTSGIKAVPFLQPELSIQFKYQIALDGARATWERVVWQMHSSSIMIKPYSPQVQWFYRGLAPFENYIPIADVDVVNINRVYNWLQANDSNAQKIVLNANRFARNNLQTVDMVAYYAVLLNEYAKLLH